MPLSVAERNKRKRERKKKEREARRKEEDEAQKVKEENVKAEDEPEVEIEYVAEPVVLPKVKEEEKPAIKAEKEQLPGGLPPAMGGAAEEGAGGDNKNIKNENAEDNMDSILRRFHQRAAVGAVVTDDERKAPEGDEGSSSDEGDGEDENKPISKRKLREITRPSISELKRRVNHPDLVEAHDITAPDPDFLIHLKGIPGTVPVPRHWGRKRKYLQGKRGYEKAPFKLPDFIIKTGIAEIRDTLAEDEAKMSAKQKNRGRVAPKMGAMDVDYKTLHEAFFKHQTKPTTLTKMGDLYYEGKELETSTDRKAGGPLSEKLREALGMLTETSPPPWLLNMQRYGPPPSYPNLTIPGLNAPLPNDQCQYGYHTGGWGKPPVDQYGRPLYGGNPFDPPGTGKMGSDPNTSLVTSDGKTVIKKTWGGLPIGDVSLYADGGDEEDDDEESGDEESSDESSDGMDESSDEEDEKEKTTTTDGTESVLPPPATLLRAAPGDLRKQSAGTETPAIEAPKQLYQVLEQKQSAAVEGAVFQSDVQYVVPGAAKAPEGAESVLSKAVPAGPAAKRKRARDADDDDDLGKNFKF